MNEMPDSEQKCSACGKDISEYRQLPHTLKLGSMLNSRYLVGGVIGEGGFGITYIGLDTLLQFRVAIKEFFPNGMVNRNNTVSDEVMSISTETAKELFSKSRENFLREARTLAKFTNESGIVAVRDFFEENRTVYIVMEYLDGITLKNYLNQVGTISAYNTVCLLMPVFHSLKKIHEKNLIHRDISPDNIMLVDEEVKLLDFGAAREFADERSLSVMLKHGYAPMEQYRRHGTQGAWTDVYAICATMYKCITGKIPPDAPDRVFEDDLKMPSELGISIEPAFEEVLRHGLAVRPEDRIQSIDELLEELDAVPGIDIGVSSQPPKSSSVEPNVGMSSGGISGGSDGARLSEYVPHLVDHRSRHSRSLSLLHRSRHSRSLSLLHRSRHSRSLPHLHRSQHSRSLPHLHSSHCSRSLLLLHRSRHSRSLSHLHSSHCSRSLPHLHRSRHSRSLSHLRRRRKKAARVL